MDLIIPTQDWNNCLDRSTGQDIPTLSCIPIVLQNIINAALILSAFVALVLIIYSGIKYISSNGDPQKVESAKKTLTWAIIGLVFLIFSFFILNLIKNLTGVNV